MTQRTKTALGTQVTTLLADNTSGDISASDVRSVFTDTADSLVGGPASATDNALVRFDATTGQLVQDSVVIVADTTGNMSGVGTLASGAHTITGALVVTTTSSLQGDVTIADGKALKTDTTTAHTALLQAYDVDGTAYKTFATLTNANTPSLSIAAPSGGTVAIDGATIGGVTPAAASVTTLTATSTSALQDDVTISNGKAIKSTTTNAHTIKLQGYDVDGTAYKTFLTITNANTPTVDLSAPAGSSGTIDNIVIGGVTPLAGAFTTASTTGLATLASATVTGNLTISGYTLRSVGNALTAAGTTRADALQLAKELNNVTTAAAGTGVILPVGVVGMRIVLFNAGANAIKVYASASETVDTVAGSTGVTLTNAKRCEYFFVAANTWISAQGGVISA